MTTAKSLHSGQWIAENKVIRPKNPKGEEPYERDCICGDCLQDNERDELEWDEFETFAKLHTYATDLPNVTYNADDLGEVVWQYTNYADKSVWSYATNPQAHKDFKAYSESCRYPTRQFLTLKSHLMSKETTPTAGLQVEKKIKNSINIVKETLSDKSTGVKIEIGSTFKVVSIDEAKELLYKLKKHLYIK